MHERRHVHERAVIPAHPLVSGQPRPLSPPTLRGARMALRAEADDAIATGDDVRAAEALLDLGLSLCSTSQHVAGLLVLDEAVARAKRGSDAFAAHAARVRESARHAALA